jgi:hypothetical protein
MLLFHLYPYSSTIAVETACSSGATRSFYIREDANQRSSAVLVLNEGEEQGRESNNPTAV